jgi:hypothetical protein
MHIFPETTSKNAYWLFNVAKESILESKYLKKDENDSDYRSNWYTKFTLKIEKTINLTACVQVNLDEWVVPVKIDELLKE